MTMTHHEIKRHATQFAVYRACINAGWDCTAAEIAAEIGKTKSTVWDVLNRMGWSDRIERERRKGRMPVYQRIALRNDRAKRGVIHG